MKKAFLIIALLTSHSLNAQQLEGRELDEIIQLYFDNQVDIVKAKLENAGFKIMKSTPDYTLNGIKHSGDFSMVREQTSKDPVVRGMGLMDESRFFFETVDYGSSKVYSVSFDVMMDYSANTYDYLAYWWSKNTIVKDTCPESPKCLHLISHVPDKPKGMLTVYDYTIRLTNTPLEAGPTRDNLHGSVYLRIAPLQTIRKAAAPVKSKGR
ncbi:hypothetical protein KLP40_02775 [Hymenobacter sp. NST-14]|uniref:hypothetical protein n=1 Tax=Hymenobacter piscis TaxID=2839984 RepID=UPI001C02B6D7|nr:hypothetical protein [Hymenobacter piscis]MBT9392077.1 hypothetical protein [Hymenobacter piscis]